MNACDNEEEKEVMDASDNEEEEEVMDASDNEEVEVMIDANDYPCDNSEDEEDSNIEKPIDGYVIMLFLCKTVINIIYYETLKCNE